MYTDRYIHTNPMTVAYVVRGFFSTVTEGGLDAVPSIDGDLGITSWLIDAAIQTEKAWDRLSAAHESAGVWEYEVSEPLGEWLANRVNSDVAPSKGEIEAKINELGAGCFGLEPVLHSPQPEVQKPT